MLAGGITAAWVGAAALVRIPKHQIVALIAGLLVCIALLLVTGRLGRIGSSRNDMARSTSALRISSHVTFRTQLCSGSRSANKMAMATAAATATVSLPSVA